MFEKLPHCYLRSHLFNNVHALHNGSKHDMLPIKPRRFGSANKELRSVGIGSSVGHAQNAFRDSKCHKNQYRKCHILTRPSMLEGKVLILKLLSVYRFSSCAIKVREVTSLTHKVWNDTMKDGALEAKTFFSSAQSSEVLGRLRHDILAKLENNTSF